MTRSPLLTAATLLAFGLATRTARAGAGYSYLTYAGPDVSLVSQGEEDTAARVNTPLGAGDRISTGRSSRAEAILADGTVVRVDARTEVRFDRLAGTYESGDDRTLLSLTSGALAVETRTSSDEDRAVRIDTEDATVVLPARGLVRVDTGRRGTEVYVLSGRAVVLARAGRATVRAGESAYVSGDEPVDVAESGLPRDRFTQFLDERRPRRGESLRHLERAAVDDADADWDDDAYAYEASLLDDAGTWITVSGRSCWRPRVGADWRPYSLGYWRVVGGCLTWVSFEPWGWRPYHFGSWFLDASFGWCWSPGWSYSPAWVYWNYTPGWVGWCPTGFYGGYDAWYGHGGRWEPGRYPHLRGRVDVTQIDGRGWNYVAASRIGGRFERSEVVRGERVSFRRGETGVVSTTPLRVERGAGVTVRAAVQEAVRRTEATTPRGTDAGLTPILRRDRELPREAQETLRRSVADVRESSVSSGRVERGERHEVSVPSRGGETSRSESWRGSGPRAEGRADARAEVRAERAPVASDSRGTSRDGWRSSPRADAPGDRFRRDEGTSRSEVRDGSSWREPRHGVESRSSGSRGESPRRDDSGWRAAPRSSETPRSSEPSRSEPSARSADPPRRDDSGWRAPAPRSEAPRSEPPRRETRSFDAAPRPHEPRTYERSYEAPRRSEPSRGYEAPRAPEPRYEAPRHEAPRYEAPRHESAPAPAPRSDPAPRAEPRSERRP